MGVNYPWVAYGHDNGSNQWGHDGFISGGWTYQTFAGSDGFMDSRFSNEKAHGGTGSLRIAADLNKDAGRPAGEVYVDLRNHPPPGMSVPTNLRDTTPRFWIWLPRGISGSQSAPSYMQPLFKSEGFFSWYGPTINISADKEERWLEIVFNTSSVPSFADAEFDPERVIFIGLKIAVTDQPGSKFKGNVYIDDYSLNTLHPIQFDFEMLEVERDFAVFRQAIGQCVAPVARVFIFTDGRASPEFASSGKVTGLDSYFFEDFDELVAVARRQNILLIPVLLDFSWFDSTAMEGGVQLGGRSDVIRNTAKRQTFLDRALKPIVQRYCNESQILAWEIINEPEWAMRDVPKDPQVGAPPVGDPVSISEMQEFVRLCASTIHSCPSQKVTVGSARRVWLGYWQGLGLDLYQFHWYDKFALASPPDAFPWPAYSELGLDKPCFVGEVPTRGSQHSTEEFLNAAYEGGYEGVLLWSYRAGDDVSSFSTSGPALESWCRNALNIIDNVEVAKKKFTIRGDCLDKVVSVLINQKPVDVDRLTISSSQIIAKGKPKALGIVPGSNQVRLTLKSGAFSAPLIFDH